MTPPLCPAPPRPTHFFSTAISFSRLLSRKAGDFLMHFRAKSFPVTLCFTRKTSEKAPLGRRDQKIRVSAGRLQSITGSNTKGSTQADLPDNEFPWSLWAPDELCRWQSLSGIPRCPSCHPPRGKVSTEEGEGCVHVLFPGSIIWEGRSMAHWGGSWRQHRGTGLRHSERRDSCPFQMVVITLTKGSEARGLAGLSFDRTCKDKRWNPAVLSRCQRQRGWRLIATRGEGSKLQASRCEGSPLDTRPAAQQLAMLGPDRPH